MSDLTAGNWIAYQNEAQKRDIDEHGQRWSIGLDNPVEFCRGVNGSDYMLVSGICTEADAKAMAAAKELIEVALIGQGYLEELIKHNGDDMGDTRKTDLERIAAVLAKVGA